MKDRKNNIRKLCLVHSFLSILLRAFVRLFVCWFVSDLIPHTLNYRGFLFLPYDFIRRLEEMKNLRSAAVLTHDTECEAYVCSGSRYLPLPYGLTTSHFLPVGLLFPRVRIEHKFAWLYVHMCLDCGIHTVDDFFSLICFVSATPSDHCFTMFAFYFIALSFSLLNPPKTWFFYDNTK